MWLRHCMHLMPLALHNEIYRSSVTHLEDEKNTRKCRVLLVPWLFLILYQSTSMPARRFGANGDDPADKRRNATLLITVNLPSKWLLTGLLAVNWLLIVIKIAAKIKFLTDGPWPQLNKSFHFAESVSVWETTLNFFMGYANLSPLTFMFVFFYFFLVEVSQPSSTALEDCIRAASVGPRGQMRGHAIPLWDICGFSTWPEPTPHTLRHPAFTFHKDWRRLSVSEEHGAKLNIFSLSVSLPSAFLPDSLRSFFFPSLLPHPPLLASDHWLLFLPSTNPLLQHITGLVLVGCNR